MKLPRTLKETGRNPGGVPFVEMMACGVIQSGHDARRALAAMRRKEAGAENRAAMQRAQDAKKTEKARKSRKAKKAAKRAGRS